MDDGAGSREEVYKNALNNLNLNELDESQLITAKFSDGVEKIDDFHPDSLDFQGVETNISNVVKYTSDITDKENIQANIFITDGAFNSGGNPVYDIQKYDKPIYVIGIGDTNVPRDISIRSIISNELGYIENPMPINVNINANGFEDIEKSVELFENGKKIDEQTLLLNKGNNQYSLIFEYIPKSEGIQKITARINPESEEISTENNEKSNFIRILKSKKKIAIFAGSPNPDLSFIKKELLQDKNREVFTYAQKSASAFYNEPTGEALAESEVIILIDFPIQSTPASAMNLIKEQLKNNKPLMFIAGKNTDYAKLRSLEDYLPFKTISTNKQEYLASPDVDSYSIASSLLRIEGDDSDIDIWNTLPPIFKTETFVQVKPESELVAGSKVNNTKIQEPLILTRSFQGQKSIAVLGYGLYRWKLMGYAGEKAKGKENTIDVYSFFVNNSIKWLSVDTRKKLFTIRAVKSQFTGNEPVEIFSEVYDASYNPVENANVSARIVSGNQQRDINLIHKGNGRYTAVIEGLSSGDHTIEGRATLKNKLIGTDEDRFSVGDLALEYTTLTMNKNLLELIAERTGGEFKHQDGNGIIEQIKALPNFKEKNITVTSEIALWSLPWILGVAILLFSIEWFMRKRAGMI